MSELRRFCELAVMAGSAFILSGALLSLILGTGRTPLDGNPAWRLILAISYLGVAVVLFPWYRETLFVLRRNWPLVLLLFLALLSCLWTNMPDLSLRKSIGLLGTTIFGVALALRVSFHDQLRMLTWLFRALAVLSLACVVLYPSYGISPEGEWMGVFDYKNAMGSAMGLSLLVEWQLPAATRFSKVLKALAMLLSGFLLVNSDSVTPGVAFVGTVILLTIYRLMALKWRVPLYAVLVTIAILGSVAMSFYSANSDSVMGMVGRSSNLTGRTEIWQLVLSFIPQKPILGYGYAGFWLGASPESLVIDRIMRGPVMYAHNGYLELLLTLGVIGLVLALIFIGIGMKRALYASMGISSTALWPLALLLYVVLHNIGECTILRQDLEWALCVAAIVGADALLVSSDVGVEEQMAFAVDEPA